MPESVAEKASRYLIEGRLLVDRVDERGIVARCRGGGAMYELGYDARRQWHCSCPARGRHCAHLLALQLVTCRRPGEDR